MESNKPICHVCLRTDINLRCIDQQFIKFHQELCETSESQDSKFCYECEHIIKKFYYFKQKCLLSSRVLLDYYSKQLETPFDRLYKHLPPSIDYSYDNSCVNLVEDVITNDTKPTFNVIPDINVATTEHSECNTEVIKDTFNGQSSNNSSSVTEHITIKTEALDESDIETYNYSNDRVTQSNDLGRNGKFLYVEVVDLNKPVVKQEAEVNDESMSSEQDEQLNAINHNDIELKTETVNTKQCGESNKDEVIKRLRLNNVTEKLRRQKNTYDKEETESENTGDDDVVSLEDHLRHVQRVLQNNSGARDRRNRLDSKNSNSECTSPVSLTNNENTEQHVDRPVTENVENPESKHTKPHFDVKRPFICNYCGYRCSRHNALVIHIRTHTKEKPFACDQCDYKCVSKPSLVKHSKTHSNDKLFECDVCDYKCNREINLKHHHIRFHTNEMPFACDLCDYKSVCEGHLARHVRTHSKQSFACEYCDYRSNFKSATLLHIKEHTKGKLFACDQCQYKCARKSTLEYHVKTHSSEKPFACNFCDYKCRQKCDLVVHIRVHTKERPFACDRCGCKFVSKSARSRHVKTHKKSV